MLSFIHQFVDLLWREPMHQFVGVRRCLAAKCFVGMHLHIISCMLYFFGEALILTTGVSNS